MSDTTMLICICLAIAGTITLRNLVLDIRGARKILESIRLYGMNQANNPKMEGKLEICNQELVADKGDV